MIVLRNIIANLVFTLFLAYAPDSDLRHFAKVIQVCATTWRSCKALNLHCPDWTGIVNGNLQQSMCILTGSKHICHQICCI